MSPSLSFREATSTDLPILAELLADDVLGASRDGPQHLQTYAKAFAAVKGQQGNRIIVALLDTTIVGMLQLTVIPGLSRGGALRAQIESVRVSRHHRNMRIGRALFDYAIDQARDSGCTLVQLSTDKRRSEAMRFYESLGFVATHEGLKMEL